MRLVSKHTKVKAVPELLVYEYPSASGVCAIPCKWRAPSDLASTYSCSMLHPAHICCLLSTLKT
jgi:hypothetical protein